MCGFKSDMFLRIGDKLSYFSKEDIKWYIFRDLVAYIRMKELNKLL